MRLRNSLIVLFLLGLFSFHISAQIGIPTFNRGNFSLKQLLYDAKEQDANILIISYSQAVPFDVLPQIKHPDSLLMKYSLITDVIDPFLEMGDLISYRLKQYSNPGWIILHPDNQILFYRNSLGLCKISKK
jgi:hypothetical protein